MKKGLPEEDGKATALAVAEIREENGNAALNSLP